MTKAQIANFDHVVLNAHDLAERRSLRYHAAIAERLPNEPELLRQALAKLEQWREAGVLHPEYDRQWRELLAMQPTALGRRLLADDQTIRALRQVSPFAGALSPRQRWQLWRVER